MAERTGIAFRNDVSDVTLFNNYVYNGSGVRRDGDLDEGGLSSLVFIRNRVRSRFYRNLGGIRFEDETGGYHV